MDALYLIIVVYVYVPFIGGLLANHALRHGHQKKAPLTYAIDITKSFNRDERAIYFLTAIFVIFSPFALHSILTQNTHDYIKLTAAALLFCATTYSAIYFFTSPAIIALYKKYTALLNLIMVIAAAVNYSRATSYAEGVIVDLTGIRASELPTALSWISIIMTPLPWIMMLAVVFMTIYALAFLGAGIRSPKKSPLHSPLHQVHVKRRTAEAHTALYALAFSCGILAITPLTLAGLLLKTNWAEVSIRNQLAIASFHIKATTCGLDKPDGAKVAPLEDGKAIAAIPSQDLGYTFELIECSKDWNSPKDIMQTYNNKNAQDK